MNKWKYFVSERIHDTISVLRLVIQYLYRALNIQSINITDLTYTMFEVLC